MTTPNTTRITDLETQLQEERAKRRKAETLAKDASNALGLFRRSLDAHDRFVATYDAWSRAFDPKERAKHAVDLAKARAAIYQAEAK